MVLCSLEPFARFDFLLTLENRLIFAASISETTPELTLQNLVVGTITRQLL